MTSSYPMMSSIFFSKVGGGNFKFSSPLVRLFFSPHILEFFDFSHVGMIYESEITKTMKGLLNSKGRRSYFSMGKKVLLCTWEKRKFLSPYLGKKVNSKIFHIHHHRKFSKLFKIIKTIKIIKIFKNSQQHWNDEQQNG